MASNYSEFDLLIESIEDLRNIDSIGFDVTAENAFTESKVVMQYNNFENTCNSYIRKIDEALSTLSSIAVDSTKLSDFFDKIKNYRKFDEYQSGIKLKNTAEVDKIKSMYLSQFVSDSANVIDDIMKGKLTETEVSNYCSPANMERMKKQIVRTTLKPQVALKGYYINEEDTVNQRLDQNLLVTFIIPFLRDFGVVKKYIEDEVNNIRNDFRTCVDKINTYNRVIEKLTSENDISESTMKTLNFFMYNFTRFLSQLFAYTSFMMVRKINNYMYNVNSLNELYNELMRYFPDGTTVLHESVLDGTFDDIDEAVMVNDILNGNSATLIAICDRIYRKLRTDYANMDSDRDSLSTLDIETSKIMDSNLYDSIAIIFTNFRQDIASLLENMKDSNIIFNDLIVKCGFENRLTDRYRTAIGSIPSVGIPDAGDLQDKSARYDLFTMMNELAHSSNLCKKLALDIKESYEKFKNVKRDLAFNDANSVNPCLRKELSDFMDEVEVQFRDLVLAICTGLLQRYRNIEDTCKSIMEPTVITVTATESTFGCYIDPFDYVESVEHDILACEDLLNASIFESKVETYNRRKAAKTLGFLYEADEAQNDPNQNNQQNQNVNGNAKTGVEVTDGTPNNQAAQDQNAKAADMVKSGGETSGDPNTDKSKFNFAEFIKNVTAFFDNMVNKFIKTIDKAVPVNQNFFERTKAGLLARSYDNTSLKMANYGALKENIYMTDLAKLKNAVNSLSSETIKSGNKDEITNHLLAFVPGIQNVANKSKGLTNYYKTGKVTEKDVPVTEFKNAKLRDEVSKMVTFCENFYGGGYKQVANQISDIKNTLKNKLQAISNETNEDASAKTGCNTASSVVKLYTAALLNCYRDRANDSIRALRKLVPKRGKNAPAPEGSQPQDQNAEQQPDQNTDQNAEPQQNAAPADGIEEPVSV